MQITGTITELKPQRKRKDRISVYLDGEYAFGLKDIVAARLHIGQELNEEEVAELKDFDSLEEAYHRSLNFISYRPRSTAEVKRNLRQKMVPDDVVEQVAARLTRVGFLNDLEFAEYWIGQRERFKPRSPQMLRHELCQKGIASHIIDEVLQFVDADESARRLAVQRMRRYEHLPEDEFKQKLMGYLQRRGFGYRIIEPIVKDLWQEKEHVTSDS